LHDVIEDTELTKDMISCIFGSTIANNVDDLTRITLDRKISSTETIKSLYLHNKKGLLLVKIFDRLHNMQTIRAKSLEKIEKITKETLTEFIIIIMYLEKTIPKMLQIEKELINLCYQNLLIKPSVPQDVKMVYEGDFRLIFPSIQNVEDQKNILYLTG
jgi:guanosine-3',5'-bis(diphosphate) 3'-pyrophosphohydrolase